MRRGPLIAIEGIDGTGKGTQARLLAQALRRRGREVVAFSFPAYQRTLAGGLIGAYLDGRMGPPRQIDSRLTAVLYALDRFELKGAIERARARGAVALCDRYVGSNLAHQAARTPAAQRPALRRTIERLEFGLFGLPRPDLVLYLDMPDLLAQERIRHKAARAYTAKQMDALEADRAHLRLALAEYRRLARTASRWRLVRTVERTGAPRTREAIHEDLMAAVDRAVGRGPAASP
jgi:dTMP kinase